jgi:cytochrome o ubiquinol oxidase operon protein cyoD
MKTVKPNYLPYVIGFALSLVFTLNAYVAVTQTQTGLTTSLFVLLVALAIAQLIVQVFFFLHLGRESRPRWNALAFITMIMVVLFIVVGSIWIMNNLNYNMMGEHVDELIIEDEGLKRE